MPTLYGPWEGTGSGKARIRVEYTRTYNAARTEAIFDGAAYIEADTAVSDSVNSWSISSPDGNFSGSNLAISIGSGGGKKKIRDFAFTKSGANADVTASVANIEYYGETVNATLELDNGDLAPYLNNSNYVAGSITQNSAVISGISGNGNGTALNGVEIQYATNSGFSGYLQKNQAYSSSVTLTGLSPGTTYYYRARVQNSGYGDSAWGTTKSFTTSPTIPTVSDGFIINNISQVGADVASIAATSTGGAAIDQTLVRVNTTPVDSGGTDFVAAGVASTVPISGLLPGTTYYVKVYLHNSAGWGGSSWKSFTTLPGVYVKVDGAWKTAVPYIRVGGVWKQATRYVKVGGAWKQ